MLVKVYSDPFEAHSNRIESKGDAGDKENVAMQVNAKSDEKSTDNQCRKWMEDIVFNHCW